MTAFNWNNELVFDLIRMFEKKPELWDISSEDYRDKDKKQEAWLEIANALETDVSTVERKMRMLMSQYRRELFTKRNSKWFAFERLSFLKTRQIAVSYKMPSSAAERQQRYREKMKNENPSKYKEMQRKNADRTNRNRKRIADLGLEEQEELRKQWRGHKKKNRDDQDKREVSDYSIENYEIEKRTKQRRTEKLNYTLKEENSDLKLNINLMKRKMCKLQSYLKKNKQLLGIIHQKNNLIEKLRLKPNSKNEEEEIHTPYTRANMFMDENLPENSLEEGKKNRQTPTCFVSVDQHRKEQISKRNLQGDGLRIERPALKDKVHITKEINRKSQDRDEYTTYGELIAMKLKKIGNSYARSTAQYHINNILYKAEIGAYDKQPRQSKSYNSRDHFRAESSSAHNDSNYDIHSQRSSSPAKSMDYDMKFEEIEELDE